MIVRYIKMKYEFPVDKKTLGGISMEFVFYVLAVVFIVFALHKAYIRWRISKHISYIMSENWVELLLKENRKLISEIRISTNEEKDYIKLIERDFKEDTAKNYAEGHKSLTFQLACLASEDYGMLCLDNYLGENLERNLNSYDETAVCGEVISVINSYTTKYELTCYGATIYKLREITNNYLLEHTKQFGVKGSNDYLIEMLRSNEIEIVRYIP